MVKKELSATDSDMTIRKIEKEDIEEIVKLARIAFENPLIAFQEKHYESQVDLFPEGQVCIEYEGKIVGSCSSIIVNFDDYGENHSFIDISGSGYIRNHNPEGKNLYGLDVVVHPDYRKMKIGRRLYEARREICKKYNLKSILFGGRIPNYHEYADQLTPHEYAEKVKNDGLYDPVLTFQLRNGFKLRGIMKNYLKDDAASLKYATLMEWHNPDYVSS